MQATSIVHATTLQDFHSCLIDKACGVEETVRDLRAGLQPAPGQSSQVAMTPWDWSLTVGRTGAAAGASAPSGPRICCTAGWRWLTPAHRDSFPLLGRHCRKVAHLMHPYLQQNALQHMWQKAIQHTGSISHVLGVIGRARHALAWGIPRAWRYQAAPVRSSPSCKCCRSNASNLPRSARTGATLSVYTFSRAAWASAPARSRKAGQARAASSATVLMAVLRQLPAAGITCSQWVDGEAALKTPCNPSDVVRSPSRLPAQSCSIKRFCTLSHTTFSA